MKRLLLALVLVLLACSSCGQSTSQTSLEDMLSMIPSETASQCVVWFADIQTMKDLTGEEENADPVEFIMGDTDDERQRREAIWGGWNPSAFSGERYLKYWPDAFGFDAFDASREMWGEKYGESRSMRSLFSVMSGDFDTAIITEKLDSLGYRHEQYDSSAYYAIRGDYEMDLKSSDASRMAMAYLNRILVTQDELIAAPADEQFFQLLDVRSGTGSPLGETTPYASTAEGLGDVLGAVLVPPSQLVSQNTQADWNDLHSYDLIGIGYDSDGETSETTILLHYPDASAAAADADELARRMADYVTIYDGAEPTALSDVYEIGRPEALSFDNDSVLKVELTREPDDIKMFWNWIDLVILGELGFLVAEPV